MLLNFANYPCHYGENHIITRAMHSYNILLYNSKADEHDFYITLQNEQLPAKTLISTEILNSEYGDVDSMICPRIKDKSNFPNSLKFKLSQYNTPHLSVDEHNFDDGAYIIKLPGKSVSMITLYTS